MDLVHNEIMDYQPYTTQMKQINYEKSEEGKNKKTKTKKQQETQNKPK